MGANAFARHFHLLSFLLIVTLVMGTFIGLAVFQTGSDYSWDTLARKVHHGVRVRLYDLLQTLDTTGATPA